MKETFLHLRKTLLEDEYKNLNPQQKEAVFLCDGPLLILSGAGSGKTTVVVNKIGYLINYGNTYNSTHIPEDLSRLHIEFLEKCKEDPQKKSEPLYKYLMQENPYHPYNLLAITFTNKAADEMRHRLQKIFNIDAHNLWALTFHSTCVRILRQNAELLGFKSNFTIYDDNDSGKLIDACIRSLELTDKYATKIIRSIISSAKGKYLNPEQFELEFKDFNLPKVPLLYYEYKKRLLDANAMDFDDLIFNTVKLLETYPEVKQKLNSRFKYILVDEYQDTNPLQSRLVKLLSEGGLICVVGDDDQSIYRFMGASVENLLSFESSFSNAKTIRLEQNYRSTKLILEAANAVISNNEKRKGKNLWTDKDEGSKIKYCQTASQHEEADYISKNILQEISGAHLKYSDICVLYRAHAQSNSIEAALRLNGIPYRIFGGLAFYKRKEIQDLLAYFNVINNPYDQTRLMRIINEPKRGIGDTTLDRIAEISADTGMKTFDVMKNAGDFEELRRNADRLRTFTEMIEDFQNKSKEISVSELFKYILSSINYIEMLNSTYDPNDASTRRENIDELLNSIVHFEQSEENPVLLNYLEKTSLVNAVDKLDNDTDAVVLMTMHCAKGLEFDTVFISGFEEGTFPSSQSIIEPGGIEEERRLCYVAITRAKRQLYIISTRSRMMYGASRPTIESRFLKEIPKDCIDETRRQINERPVKKLERSLKDRHILKDAVTVVPQKATNQKYILGQKVKHLKFGEGTIISSTPMSGDNLLEVDFNEIGIKKLMANFAKLEIL